MRQDYSYFRGSAVSYSRSFFKCADAISQHLLQLTNIPESSRCIQTLISLSQVCGSVRLGSNLGSNLFLILLTPGMRLKEQLPASGSSNDGLQRGRPAVETRDLILTLAPCSFSHILLVKASHMAELKVNRVLSKLNRKCILPLGVGA